MAEILVVAEHRRAKLADISLQVLGLGQRLAEEWGAELVAVVVGGDVSGYAETLARWADRVLSVRATGLDEPLAEPCQRILAGIIRERNPALVLMGHTSFAMDLAPALAVELGAPLATDCVDVALEDGGVRVTRSVYGGKVNALYSMAAGETAIVTGRVGEFSAGEGNRRGEIEEVAVDTVEEYGYKQFEGYVEQEAGGVDITQADVLVAVGRGIGDRENIRLAEQLAAQLGGVVACSRPVVDQGWLPAEHQVGLSGRTVGPKLYLALGISGAFQHMVGCRGARMLVAINRDPKAPIFAAADYGIVEDVLRIVPVLAEKIAETRS